MSAAVRIGFLRDVHAARQHDFGGNALRLVVDEANAAGGVQGRQVELVERITEGPAFGTQEHVDTTAALWRELANDPSILGIVGPSTTPCVAAVHEAVEQTGIPQIHWAGTDRACGDWHFQFQAGYLPDEGRALAYLLTRLGHRRVVCFCGEGAYGDAYMSPFTEAAGPQNIEILARIGLSHTAADVGDSVAEASRLGADAVVAMGLLGVGDKLVAAMRQAGWDAPCFGHDLATLMIEGLRAAPEFSRAGLRKGLESLRGVPAATGGAGSYMAFSERDRQALMGPRLFVFNRITPQGLELIGA